MTYLNKNAQEIKNDLDLAKVTTKVCDGQRDDEKHIGIYKSGTTQGIVGGNLDSTQPYQGELKALGKVDELSGSPIPFNLRRVARGCYSPTFMGVSSNDKMSSSNLEDVGLIPSAPANYLTISTGD